MSNNFMPDYFTPPYEILNETLESLGMTHKELSVRTGISEKHISSIVSGKSIITKETAFKFEPVLGIPADFWISLETKYELFKERRNYQKSLEEQSLILKKLDYNYFEKYCDIPNVNTTTEKIKLLCNFFNVSSLVQLNATVDCLTKVSSKNANLDYSTSAWILMTEILAKKIKEKNEVEPCKKIKIKKLSDEIKNLTIKNSLSYTDLFETFIQYGIVLVCTPYFKNSNVRGVVKELENGIYMIAVNDRNKSDDLFWFSIAHEIGHIEMKHLKKNKFLLTFSNEISSDFEKEADDFATNFFISQEEYEGFNKSNVTETSIIKFAKNIGICPGIVVGRLQHEKIIPYNYYNSLKTRLEVKPLQ